MLPRTATDAELRILFGIVLWLVCAMLLLMRRRVLAAGGVR
jgi:hypothetical protein